MAGDRVGRGPELAQVATTAERGAGPLEPDRFDRRIGVHAGQRGDERVAHGDVIRVARLRAMQLEADLAARPLDAHRRLITLTMPAVGLALEPAPELVSRLEEAVGERLGHERVTDVEALAQPEQLNQRNRGQG